MCPLYIGWCLYSLILVFIHLFDFFSLLTINLIASNSRLGFHIGLFLECSLFLPIRLLKPTLLLFVFWVYVEVNGGKLPVVRFMQSGE